MTTYRLLRHFSKSAPSFRNSIATTHSRTTTSDYYSIRRFVSSSPRKERERVQDWISIQKEIEDLKKGYMELKKCQKSTKDWILQVEVDGMASYQQISHLKVSDMCNYDKVKNMDTRITELEEVVFPKGVKGIAKAVVKKSFSKVLIQVISTLLLLLGGSVLESFGLLAPLKAYCEAVLEVCRGLPKLLEELLK